MDWQLVIALACVAAALLSLLRRTVRLVKASASAGEPSRRAEPLAGCGTCGGCSTGSAGASGFVSLDALRETK